MARLFIVLFIVLFSCQTHNSSTPITNIDSTDIIILKGDIIVLKNELKSLEYENKMLKQMIARKDSIIDKCVQLSYKILEN